MKKFYMIAALLAISLSGAGCFEDKGNYSYSDVNQLTIDMGNDGLYLSMGQSVELTPTIKFTNGTGDTERLTYRWYLRQGKDIYAKPEWNTLNLSWTPDFLIKRNDTELVLEVTDPVTGLQTLKTIGIEVKSIYNSMGILVLSEKDGQTMFSYIKCSDRQGHSAGGETPFQMTEYIDAYTTDNNGEKLPAGPIGMHQHSCTDANTITQILALTEDGAVDISGMDFKKEITLDKVFEGGAYPSNLDYVAQAMFMARVDVVADSQGHLYTRMKNTDKLFHSGEFLSDRLKYEGEELKGCRLVAAPYGNWFNYGMIHDTNKKRLLLVGDYGSGSSSGSSMAGAGVVIPVTVPNVLPEHFLSPSDLSGADVLWIGHYDTSNTGIYWSLGYNIVYEKNGSFYWQDFVIERDGPPYQGFIRIPTAYEIKGLPGTPTCVFGGAYKDTNSLIFFAVGNALYMYDRKVPNGEVIKWGDFRSDIVSMNGNMFGGWWLCLGLADGSVLLVNAMKVYEPTNKYVYYDSMREIQKLPQYKESDGTLTDRPVNQGDPVNFGKIIDVRLK